MYRSIEYVQCTAFEKFKKVYKIIFMRNYGMNPVFSETMDELCSIDWHDTVYAVYGKAYW
jgi:hypothetical protein